MEEKKSMKISAVTTQQEDGSALTVFKAGYEGQIPQFLEDLEARGIAYTQPNPNEIFMSAAMYIKYMESWRNDRA